MHIKEDSPRKVVETQYRGSHGIEVEVGRQDKAREGLCTYTTQGANH